MAAVKTNEEKISEAALKISKSHIQIEGWLLKKSRVLKKWRKRWIVLAGNTIYTYKNQKEYSSEPTETIDISSILTIKKHEDNNKNNKNNNNTNHQYSFELELETKLIFVFAADSITYRDQWIKELNKLINLNRECLITKDSLGKNGKILSFGCKHFRRNCSYLCSCCNKWYFCSYCHDSIESGFINGGHELERKSIIAIKCCYCGKEQKPSNQCIKCNKNMANYYCQTCKFWDNDPNHQLFHCNKCGVCRSGKKSDYIHCDKCGVCLDKVESLFVYLSLHSLYTYDYIYIYRPFINRINAWNNQRNVIVQYVVIICI